MSSWLIPLPVRDAYDAITRKLRYPSSETLRRIMELAMSLEEAELLLAMPGTVDSLAEKLNRNPQVVKAQIERMFWAGLIMEYPNPDGTMTYTPPTPFWSIETASDQMLWAIGGNHIPKSGKTTGQDLWGRFDKNTEELCELWNKFFYEEWYRWQRPNELVHRNVDMLGGSDGLAKTFGMMPAAKALEKSEAQGTEILPEWDLREFARRAEKSGMYCRACSCRTRNRGCDVPLWLCGTFWEGQPGREGAFDLNDRRGQLHKYAAEEWLEIMFRCEEDLMVVHMGDSWLAACNCCRDCCNWLVPLRMYAEPWEGVQPSPYRAMVNREVCEGCTQGCFPRCAFKVIEGVKDPVTGKVKPHIDPDKCVGCGQCVVGCKVEGAMKMELAEKAGAHVPEMSGRAKIPTAIPGSQPKIPRPR